MHAQLWRSPPAASSSAGGDTPGASGSANARSSAADGATAAAGSSVSGSWLVFVAGLGPDEAPLEILCLPPGGDAADGGSWLRVLDDLAGARLAAAAWGGWLLAQ